MNQIKAKLTVLFEDPFWIGVYEREADGVYEACRIVFGAEPKDYEVYAFMLSHLDRLRFGIGLAAEPTDTRKINPKRMQRAIHRQMQEGYQGTKAQQAIKLLQEQNKQERKADSREQRLLAAQRLFEQRQEKKKEKHKGH